MQTSRISCSRLKKDLRERLPVGAFFSLHKSKCRIRVCSFCASVADELSAWGARCLHISSLEKVDDIHVVPWKKITPCRDLAKMQILKLVFFLPRILT